MRTLIAIAILGALWIGTNSAARADESPVKGINLGWVDPKGNSIANDRVVYVGFEEEFFAIPYGEAYGEAVTRFIYATDVEGILYEGPGLGADTDILVDMPLDLLFTDFLTPTYSAETSAHVFHIKPRYAGPDAKIFRFDVKFPGRTEVLYSETFSFEVRHCLNGLWRDGRRTLEICQSGDDVYATVKSELAMVIMGRRTPRDRGNCGRERTAFTFTLDGETFKKGKMTACTPKKCQKPEADIPYSPKIFKDRDFKGEVSKDGRLITGEFKRLSFERDFKGKSPNEISFCKRRKLKDPWSRISFQRQTFGPRCGAPCLAAGETAPVSVPGLE